MLSPIPTQWPLLSNRPPGLSASAPSTPVYANPVIPSGAATGAGGGAGNPDESLRIEVQQLRELVTKLTHEVSSLQERQARSEDEQTSMRNTLHQVNHDLVQQIRLLEQLVIDQQAPTIPETPEDAQERVLRCHRTAEKIHIRAALDAVEHALALYAGFKTAVEWRAALSAAEGLKGKDPKRPWVTNKDVNDRRLQKAHELLAAEAQKEHNSALATLLADEEAMHILTVKDSSLRNKCNIAAHEALPPSQLLAIINSPYTFLDDIEVRGMRAVLHFNITSLPK